MSVKLFFNAYLQISVSKVETSQCHTSIKQLNHSLDIGSGRPTQMHMRVFVLIMK